MFGMHWKSWAAILGRLVSVSAVYFIGTAIDEDVFVEAGRGVNGLSDLELSPEYILKSRREATSDRKASTAIYKAYKTKPSPDQVFQDFIAVYSSKTQSYGRVEYSGTGDTNIILNSVGEETETPSDKSPE